MYNCRIKRGAFIVFEGCDRSGKSTQSDRLCKYLNDKCNISADYYVFPNRRTIIGRTIDDYLKNVQTLSDEVVHLLFTANRWEFHKEIKETLMKGITVVADRYLYSGIAYSAAKGLSYEWCMAPERGLIRPDKVFYLKVNCIDKIMNRGNFGDERYEKKEFQTKVSQIFDEFSTSEAEYWEVINAENSEDEIHEGICSSAKHLLEKLHEDLKFFH